MSAAADAGDDRKTHAVRGGSGSSHGAGGGGPAGRMPIGALVMLGVLTAATLVGPVIAWVSLRGGASREWPPDRPVEWWTITAVFVGYTLIWGATLAVAWRAKQRSLGK